MTLANREARQKFIEKEIKGIKVCAFIFTMKDMNEVCFRINGTPPYWS